MIQDIFWWIPSKLCCLIALFYLMKTSQLLIMKRKKAETPTPIHEHRCPKDMPIVLLCLFIWWLFIRRRIYQLPSLLADLQLPPSFYLCLLSWLLVCFCAMIQTKVWQRQTWRELMDQKIEGFLKLFMDVRTALLSIEYFWLKISPQLRAFIFLLWFAAITVAVLLFSDNSPVLIVLSLGVIIIYFVVGACRALHSCRRLLLFWLGDSFLLSLLVASLVPQGSDEWLGYLLFQLIYTALWLLLAGAADHDVAKMSCSIINTFTTILIITINVIAVWGRERVDVPILGVQFWDMLQDYSVTALLPLVIGGYLASLLKELQCYWETRL